VFTAHDIVVHFIVSVGPSGHAVLGLSALEIKSFHKSEQIWVQSIGEESKWNNEHSEHPCSQVNLPVKVA